MLQFFDPSRFGRRTFLQVGASALAGYALSADQRSRAASPETSIAEKSVVFLFLHGGPSQIETFDPHMEAPVETRSAIGEVKTAIPGVTFGGMFPKIAGLADQVSIVRSYVSGDGNHDIKPVVGKDSSGANLGSALAYVAGANHPSTGMPRNLLLFPRAVDPSTQPGISNFGNFASFGPLGATTAPFAPGSDGAFQKSMKLALPVDRFDDRRALLNRIDQARSTVDELGTDAARDQALRILLGGAADAFDLRHEDSKTIARYDTAPLLRPEAINKKWNNHKNYADNAKALGKLMLLARRLCERGAGFVTVTTNFVWDMHADSNNATMTEGMGYMAPALDYAVSAFLEDLQARGLSEKILLVVTGEMGRTPKINKNGGRDHWGNLAPLLLAGGGLKMGQVIGKSSRDGGEPNSDPIRIPQLVSTIMHTMFDVGKLRVIRGVPREIMQMTDAAPIPGVM